MHRQILQGVSFKKGRSWFLQNVDVTYVAAGVVWEKKEEEEEEGKAPSCF